MQEEEIKYYPDSLQLDESVVYSYKPSNPLNFLSPQIYYITNKRIFSENKWDKLPKGVDYSKIRDLHLKQTESQKNKNIGTLMIEHSNYKHNVPINRKKYFILPNIKDPETAFLVIKREISKHQKDRE